MAMLGTEKTQILILLSSHQQTDPQCWPFRQQPANRLHSHLKQLWGAAKSGFYRKERDITIPLALTNNNHAIQRFDFYLLMLRSLDKQTVSCLTLTGNSQRS